MTDSPVLDPNKVILDSYTVSEATAFDVSTAQSDNFSMSDVLVPVMDFVRTFDDDYSFADNEVFDIGKGYQTLQPLVNNRSLMYQAY